MRRLAVIDRIATLLVGGALMAAGLALLDWRLGRVRSWPDALSTASADDVVSTGWWPWAFAAGGILLGMVGLTWLLAHVPRRGERVRRLHGVSTEHGAVNVDYQSVASAIADDFEARSPVSGVTATTRRRRGVHVVEVRGHLDQHATRDSVEAAAARVSQNVSDAFPDGSTVSRVLLGRDRRRPWGRGRTSTPRVH